MERTQINIINLNYGSSTNKFYEENSRNTEEAELIQ